MEENPSNQLLGGRMSPLGLQGGVWLPCALWSLHTFRKLLVLEKTAGLGRTAVCFSSPKKRPSLLLGGHSNSSTVIWSYRDRLMVQTPPQPKIGPAAFQRQRRPRHSPPLKTAPEMSLGSGLPPSLEPSLQPSTSTLPALCKVYLPRFFPFLCSPYFL